MEHSDHDFLQILSSLSQTFSGTHPFSLTMSISLSYINSYPRSGLPNKAATRHMGLVPFKLLKMIRNDSVSAPAARASFQVLKFLWPWATELDRADSEYFHHCSQFYWTAVPQIRSLYSASFSPTPKSIFSFPSCQPLLYLLTKKCLVPLSLKKEALSCLLVSVQAPGLFPFLSVPDNTQASPLLIPELLTILSPINETVPSKTKFSGPFAILIFFTCLHFPAPLAILFSPCSVSIILKFSVSLTSIPFFFFFKADPLNSWAIISKAFVLSVLWFPSTLSPYHIQLLF